ncbi:hypothetical protein FJT64_011267 [Amphibalanus amphitrite]|uniref:Uncharacterized protein n=1 Tax=Amphibalanus amphitrite TaxID=1232801 RepID=A0A6A4V2N9_AMPAM|nr:hypothetical protein FJT64_011267 [Amphibalanus amphitrite]
MSGPPYYPHVYRPAGHEASPYQPAASAAISPPMSQGRLPYSSGASGVYHPAGVVVTAPGPAPSHHDVRWQQAVAAAAAAAAAPSPYSVRNTPVCLTVSAPLLGPQMQLARLDGERDRVDRLAVPRMHLHDPHAAAAAEIYERQRYKHLVSAAARRPEPPPSRAVPGTDNTPRETDIVRNRARREGGGGLGRPTGGPGLGRCL